MENKKIIIFLHKFPYPPKDSTKLRIFECVIKPLKELADLEFLIITWENPKKEEINHLKQFGNLNLFIYPQWRFIFNALRSFFSFRPFQTEMFYFKNVDRLFKKLIDNYDVFWVRLPSPFGLWLGKEAEKNNKFVIYHVAGDIRMAYLSSKYKGIKKIIAQLMGNYLHRKSIQLGKNGVFLCTGSILYNIYKKANKKVFYFIDSTILSKDLKEPKRSLIEPIKFLYVGRILEEKGIFFLIDAMKELKEKYKLELHIVGFGKDENKLKQIIKDEDFIIFHGFIPQGEKLYEIYSSSDVFVMPTINYPEGFPRVILEAWANGLFVISSRVGGIEGLGQDFGNLLFFRPGDKSEFIKKVELILDNSEIRERLRNGILQIQRKITSEYMINFLKEILIEEGII